MSYELKMQGADNGKRSRLYKKTRRASMNKIDATHYPEAVNVLEPHSHKTEALIKEFWGHLESRIPNFTGYIPVYPDAGAVNRYQTLGEVLICSKTRNPDDDLCDAGGTFVGIANKIREVNPDRKLAIYVTHMVNPKGITTLSENYDEVYFTNSYADWDEYMKLPDNVRIIKVI